MPLLLDVVLRLVEDGDGVPLLAADPLRRAGSDCSSIVDFSASDEAGSTRGGVGRAAPEGSGAMMASSDVQTGSPLRSRWRTKHTKPIVTRSAAPSTPRATATHHGSALSVPVLCAASTVELGGAPHAGRPSSVATTRACPLLEAVTVHSENSSPQRFGVQLTPGVISRSCVVWS